MEVEELVVFTLLKSGLDGGRDEKTQQLYTLKQGDG